MNELAQMSTVCMGLRFYLPKEAGRGQKLQTMKRIYQDQNLKQPIVTIYIIMPVL